MSKFNRLKGYVDIYIYGISSGTFAQEADSGFLIFIEDCTMGAYPSRIGFIFFLVIIYIFDIIIIIIIRIFNFHECIFRFTRIYNFLILFNNNISKFDDFLFEFIKVLR